MIRFDPAHGGYPGEIVTQDEYLQCTNAECSYSYPLDSMANEEPCDMCGAELIIARAYPCESTLKLL